MKWHQIIENDEKTKEISRICNLIFAAEDAWIETNTDYITVDPYQKTVYLPEGIPEIQEIIDDLNNKYSEEGIRFSLGDAGYHYKDLYNLVRERFLNTYISLIKTLVNKSLIKQREYAMIILREGKLILLEGEEERITLPEIPSCIFLHTHPGPWCFPSKKDVEQTTSFFMNGGLLNVIAAEKCLLTMARTWLLGEEDVLALKELERKINSIYKRSRDPLWEIKNLLKNTVIEANALFL